MNRRLKMGMVGGGRGAFIGGVHRIAAAIDGKIELVCGAFSSTPEKSKASAADLLIPPDRAYGTYQEMMRAEAKRPAGDRMDFVAIVTPNSTHFPIAMAALSAGFHVICDKPMTLSLDQALKLEAKVKQTGLLFALTHNYTGNAMVKAARELVRSGQLGKIRRIVAEYPQGWLATRLESSGQKQAGWRTNPKLAGGTCCIGDIGSHAENLAEYITGLKIKELCADLATFVKGRPLDDDGSILAHFENGAQGIIWASQIAIGCENSLNIRIFGEKGSLEWHQQEPNSLIVDWLDKPREIRRTATPYAGAAASAVSRIPAGHPEGYLEAFANIYRNFAKAVEDKLAGKKIVEEKYDYPTVHDGVRGMAFLETVVKSNKKGSVWAPMPKV
jgi:predicted dehydrogenase